MKVKLPKTFDKFLEKWYDTDKLSDEEYKEYDDFLYWFSKKSQWLVVAIDEESDSGLYEENFDEESGILSLEQMLEYPAYNLPETPRLPIYAFIIGKKRTYDKMKLETYERQDTEFNDIDYLTLEYIKAPDLEVSTKRIVGEEYEKYVKEWIQ